MKVKGYLLSRYPSWGVYLYQLKISLAEGVPLSNDEHNTKAGPTVWVAQEAHGSVQTLTFRYQNRPFNSQFSLPTASVHCTECGRNLHDLLLTPFHCLKLDALLCKQGTHASILGATLGGKQDCWWAGSISFSLGTVVIGFPYLWPLPCPFHHHQFPNEELFSGDWHFSACPCNIKIQLHEVLCLAVKAQSSKTSIPIVTCAGTPSPCRGLWNGCQENTIMCWHENKYNSLT